MTSSGLEDYEILGDPDAPFEVTKSAKKRQRDAEATRRAVTNRPDAPAPLTHEQMRAGEPCPGCRRALIDSEPWEFRGTMYMSDDERTRYEAEQADFGRLHDGCQGGRWSMAGSLTTHCMRCCPPAPMSRGQLEALGKLVGKKTPDHDLMRWQVRLYCGHKVERVAHRSHKTVHSALGVGRACPTCGLDPAVPVDARALGLIAPRAEAPVVTKRTASQPKPGTKAHLAAELAEERRKTAALEEELQRLRNERS